MRRRHGRLVLSLVGLGGLPALAACSIRQAGAAATPPAPAPASTAHVATGRTPPPPTAGPAAGTDSVPGVAQAAIAIQADSQIVRAIVAEGMQRSRVGPDLEYLSDVIGPRLTGSPAQRRASEWAADKFREYRADSAWTEPWSFGRPWERGPIALTLLAPHAQQLIGASWAWAPGTAGPVTGDVVYVDARTPAEYDERFAGTVKGKWVLTRPPPVVWNSDGPPMSAADSALADSVQASYRSLGASPDLVQFRQSLPGRLAHDHALGVLADGGKEFGLLTMSGSPLAPYPLPFVVLPHETFGMLHRLLAQGQRATLRADIANSLGPDTTSAVNTVAELRGTSKPAEVVLLGAHLDSWDLATGTTDNAAGAIAVLEAARILSAAHVRPARTIRFVLFTGEEEGLLGSEAYAAQHAAELKRYQAVLVLDNGTGRITGVSLQGRNDLHDAWRALFAPVAGLGPFTVRARDKGGTDHLSFLPYGVPSFNFDQESRGYGHTHHSQVDTFDHAVPGDIRQAAIVLAATAYELAATPDLLPRGPASVVVGQ